MKNLILSILLLLTVYGYGQTCNTVAPNYTTITSACNSGNFSTASEWVGGINPPFTLSGGAYTIPAGVVVDIASSTFQLDYDLIVYGTLLIDGKLSMTNSTNKIVVMSGGLVTCCSTGYCGASCATCGASDKIAIGNTNVYCGVSCGAVNGSFTGYAVLSNVGLPITLSSFTAEVNGNKIDLTWVTESEINFDYVSVERSANGIDFNELTRVQGHGTTNVRHVYSAVDGLPLIGMNYYRIKSVDFDNYQETFKVVVVDFKGGKQVSISPNPIDQSSKLVCNFEFNGTVQVYNNVGLLIGNGVEVLSTLPSGFYLVTVSDADFKKTIRVVKN